MQDHENGSQTHEEFHRYRTLNMLAVVSTVFGALSILTAFTPFLGPVPVAGVVLAMLALRQIRRAPEEYTGRGFAVAGLLLSLGLWAVGAGCYVYGQYRDVPHGYKLISFDDLQPDPDVSGEVIPPAVLELNDKKVFIRGYMYPGRQYTRIKQFILVPTIEHCNFCSRSLKSTEVIRIKLVGDLMTDYENHMAGFGGTLRIDQEQASRPFGGVLYQIDADEVR